MAGDEPEFLIVGSVQKPHGIKGELFVRLETDRPDAVFSAGRALILGDGEGRDELLIPFVREMIRRIDPAEGVLELDLPVGLLEL